MSRNTLHRFVMREAALCGRQKKRYCATCGTFIGDRSRSKFCKAHRHSGKIEISESARTSQLDTEVGND